MFVSISFIVLMMISLAWLVFYYIQRFRYLHAKDRLSVTFLPPFLLVSRLHVFVHYIIHVVAFAARTDQCSSEGPLQNSDEEHQKLGQGAVKILFEAFSRLIEVTVEFYFLFFFYQEVTELECCAVCIEPYKASDVVRLLPCR